MVDQTLQTSAIPDKSDIPLVVDLDGTLIHSDLLIESALQLLHKKPWMLFSLLYWLLQGKACLKRMIANRVRLDAETLPYNTKLCEWLRQQRGTRRLILSTASDALLVSTVAEHTALFDEVITSDGITNNAGKKKASTLLSRFGAGGFDYVGNTKQDLPVWRQARHAIVVGNSRRLVKQASAVSTVTATFPVANSSPRVWGRALRLHQWIKNLLIFIPLLAAHLVDSTALLHSLSAFLIFGLCASSVYLLNDLLDLQADRRHHTKRHRPFAAGALPLLVGILLSPILTIIAFLLALLIGAKFALALASYYLLTLGYSSYFKRKVMLDVVVLAGLYTMRILAGSAAIDVIPSFWLLAFSMFIFLSLAMLKRYTELIALRSQGSIMTKGRGYHVDDIPLIQSLGGASGYLAVLVLALYIDSTTSQALYHRPHALWLICPIMLYWISRAWVIAHRGAMHDDPVIFAIKDQVSRLLVAAMVIVVIFAI